jgi:Lon-like ATP-dependent protease
VLPVGGVTAKIEAAAESGIRKVLIPLANMRDVVLEEKYIGKIEIVPVSNMNEVLQNALIGGIKKDSLLKKLAALVEQRTEKPDKPPVFPIPVPLAR